MDAVDRLFALLQEKHIEQKAFAAEIGVAPARISEWKSRDSKSYVKYISEIAAALGTTTEYILTGDMPARPREGDELLDAVRGLTDEERKKVLDYIALLEAARHRQ